MTLKRVSLVRRRDGETEAYDPERVVDSVRRALAATGAGGAHLADEIGGIVSVFLEKSFYDEIPDVDQVEQMVEKVLLETGYDSAAKAFILYRDRAARLRQAESARGDVADPTLFGPRAIMVEDAAHGAVTQFSHERLARVLSSDGLLGRDEARDIASRVEQRLRRAGVARAPASLVRALAEVEIFDRTLALDLRRRAGAVLQPEDLASALHRRSDGRRAPAPRQAAEELGGSALRFHSLSELLPADAAQAHMDGDLHCHGLAAPAALFTASITPVDVVLGRVPGGGTRGVSEAAGNSRRLSAALGRGARSLSDATEGSVAVGLCPLSFSALALGASDAELAEDAWHLLHACSRERGRAPIELDLSPDVPDRLADGRAVDGDGEALEVPNGELGEAATRFAAAVLRARARAGGLPPTDSLPVPVMRVSERTLATPAARSVLRQACDAVLAGDRVVFVLGRGGAVLGGSSMGRSPEEIFDPRQGARAVGGRVTLNLPRAAMRAGRGQLPRFRRICDRLVEHAARIHRRRRELLSTTGCRSGGSMAPLLRSTRSRAALYDLSDLSWSIGVTGLNEAVQALTGFELHESQGDGEKTARSILEYLRLRVIAAAADSDFKATLDADEDASVTARFAHLDRREARWTGVTEPPAAYTAGVAVRGAAPVDVLHRVECEDALHRSLTTATLRLPLSELESGGADGLLALLSKLLRVGAVRQVEFGTW